MANNISFIGRLVRDSELKADVGSGLLNFTVANETGWGEKKVVSFYNCSMFGARGAKLVDHLTKGKQMVIYGELSLRKYTDKEGNERLSPDVNVSNIDFAGGGQGEAGSNSGPDSEVPF